MILPKQSLRHSHLLMRMIGKKLSVAIWTLFSPMELGSWSKDYMVANLWVASGCCYRHNLTGPKDGPRATWAEGDHRDGLRIGFCASVLRARMAVYLVRIV
jgi:hypothetical protein